MRRKTPKASGIVIGFRDETALVRQCARALHVPAIFANISQFPAGEMRVRIPPSSARQIFVVSNAGETPGALFRLLLLSEALRGNGAARVCLIAPWIAYGRQDCIVHRGEAPAGRLVGKLLAEGFDRIITLDAHSLAFIRSFNGKLQSVVPLPDASFLRRITLVAAPDHGAAKRARHIARLLGLPCIVVEKKREDGSITSKISIRESQLHGAHTLLVDDLADSGGTLVSASCVLRTAGAASVFAWVTHAVDLGGLTRATAASLHRVGAAFDHKTGKISTSVFNLLADAARRR